MIDYQYAITGYPTNIVGTLNRKIGQFKRQYPRLKIGITGRDPNVRFNEHKKSSRWEKMIILYITQSQNFANTIENWLVENHKDYLTNMKPGGGSELSKDGKNFVYLLVKS